MATICLRDFGMNVCIPEAIMMERDSLLERFDLGFKV
jgi:hypothetical protein